MVTYDADTKAQALALAEELGVAVAARRLGIPTGTIKAWRNRSGATATRPLQPRQPQGRPASPGERVRDGNGRWLPGVSGNPSGKRSETREAHRKAEEAAPEAVDVILALMRDPGTPERVRLEAAREVLDRALGRPKQRVDMDVEGVSQSVNVTIVELDAARREILGRIDRLASARGALVSAGQGDGDG